jgi:hypothetical protein
LRQLEADLAYMTRISMMEELAGSLAHEIKQPVAAAAISPQLEAFNDQHGARGPCSCRTRYEARPASRIAFSGRMTIFAPCPSSR